MPVGGRSRTGKRNAPSASYTSTITTIAFIALCVVGVWMLTSNTVEQPQTTNRAGKIDTPDTSEVQASESQATKKDAAVYEDNPGDLPADAIKSDEPKSKEEESENEKKDADGDGGGAIEEKVTESSQDDLKAKESSSEEKDMQAEKQTQISEESIVTQDQQVQEGSTSSDSEANLKDANQVDQQQDGGREGDETAVEQQNTENPDTQNQQKDEQQISDGGGGGGGGNSESAKDSPNLKNFEELQQKQRLEDAGLLAGANAQGQDSSQNGQQDDQTQKKSKQKNKEKQVKKQKPEQSYDLGRPEIKQETKSDANPEATTTAGSSDQDKANEVSFPGGGMIPKESKESKKSWSTQATESENQKERRKDESDGKETIFGYTWQLCNVTAGADYIPCLDNEKALRQLHTTRHYEHRERHCPEEGPTCLVSVPEGYKRPIPWPQSRDKIWYYNVPHTKLAEVKGHQNWVKVTGEFLTFPGGGTQFIHGALHYIDFVQEAVPEIAWGKQTRVVLDVGCGVASFGGYLFDKDVLTMSFAPKDEHEAQVQFALERGIPAISAVMGSQRLPFPSMVFDIVHCARCRVPWHAEGGMLLLELNRVLRPGGFFVWSATPVYQKLEEDVEIWEAMSALTASMCWELVTIKKDKLNSVGAAIYRKPISNECYDQRKQKNPPMCKEDDDANAAWYVPLQACMHRVPADESRRGNRWPEEWPSRVMAPPYWLNSSQMGIYGKPAPQDFAKDYDHWKHLVSKTYLKNMGISWANVRNVMDMRAVYGGFAAALKDLQVWVMNVVNVDGPDTLPIIYERGMFGIYHDWCQSFSTYPRTYDLLHADHLFSILKKRCKLAPVLAEIDRIVRPGGKLIIRDESSAIGEVENLLKSLRWEVHLTFSKDQEGLLSAQKGDWRPQTYAASS